jgi:hypothetical protein
MYNDQLIKKAVECLVGNNKYGLDENDDIDYAF